MKPEIYRFTAKGKWMQAFCIPHKMLVIFGGGIDARMYSLN